MKYKFDCQNCGLDSVEVKRIRRCPKCKTNVIKYEMLIGMIDNEFTKANTKGAE